MNHLEQASSANSADASSVHAQLGKLRVEQERLFAQLHAGEQHFRQLARSVWRVQEDERRRLARELHDGIGQNLTALRHRLESLAAAVNFPPNLGPGLCTAIELCSTALEETRSLSRLLRPQILDDLGLEPALQWLLRSVAESSAVNIEVEIQIQGVAIDGELATLVFRLVQEGLNNMGKHAAAHNAVVRLTRRGSNLQLLIVDDGKGCDAERALKSASTGQSTGLASMRERVLLFGGHLQFRSSVGEGTQLRVTLPLEYTET